MRKDTLVTRTLARGPVFLLITVMVLGGVFVPSASLVAQDGGTSQSGTPAVEGGGVASPVPTEDTGAVDLDVLFVGAHPDDESGGLSTYGQWNEYHDLDVGVITITRGEGGGNAVGTEEGPALGLLREQEERRAVGMAGIENIYYLDKVDFYYTVSAPLTQETWGYEDTLERVVRVVRSTTPEVLVTMNPAPTPGNHGHHQMAARFAVTAYEAAADPSMFPDQIEDEGLSPFAPSKIFRGGFDGEDTTGEACATEFTKTEPTDVVYGVWGGRQSEANDGQTWAAIERDAQREYASQGWSVFPDVPDDPAELECDYFTLVDSRVPYTVGNTEPTAPVEGALTETTGGLPAGTLFDVERAQFDVLPGEPFEVNVSAQSVDVQASDISVSYELPEGWTSEVVNSTSDRARLNETIAITPSEDADAAMRYRVTATLTIDGATGQNVEVVEVAPPVEGHLEPLPQIAQFRDWVAEVNAPVLDNLIKPVVSMGVGETREFDVTVTNNSTEPQDASVTVVLQEGFTVENETQSVSALGAGESTTVTFSVTNEDVSLPTGVEGGMEGDYLLDIRTVGASVSTTEQAGINLVPVVNLPAIGATPGAATPVATTAEATPMASPVAEAPDVDGVIVDGEYASVPLDLSRVWEGDDPDSPQDASGQAWLSYDENGIYVAVDVTDEAQGTVLPNADAKRHWRTDSVEIAIDPLGTAENTSATFKVGIFPEVEEGGPAAYRDADAYQGPIAETAPGMELASTVSDPYNGYVIETFIPFEALPAPVDPDDLAMNIFIYDSDTDDLTGQTRLGWSVWQGVQGDPYRWGHVNLLGYPEANGAEPEEPQMPLEAAQSVNSPWSIIQAARDGVPPGGSPAVLQGSEVTVTSGPTVQDGVLTATVEAGEAGGSVHAFVVSDGEVLGDQTVDIEGGQTVDLSIDIGDTDPASMTFAMSFESNGDRVQPIATPVEP